MVSSCTDDWYVEISVKEDYKIERTFTGTQLVLNNKMMSNSFYINFLLIEDDHALKTLLAASLFVVVQVAC